MGKISVDYGDRSRSIEINRSISHCPAIFSFQTVEERQRLVEMVKRGTFFPVLRGVRAEVITGTEIHRTKVTVEFISVIILF